LRARIAPGHLAGRGAVCEFRRKCGGSAPNRAIGSTLIAQIVLLLLRQRGGFTANSPTGSMGSSDAASNAQLVQAMAGFGSGSGAADSLNTAPIGADTSQQPLLTTPQHA
jgi:hypothetical protein